MSNFRCFHVLFTHSHYRFVAEESAYGKKLPTLTDDPTWIIDPIDGTTNFMKGVKLNCISIGLAVNQQLVAGIVYNPCMDELYTAKKGEGTFLNGQPIHTSNVDKFQDSLISFSLFGRPMNIQRLRAITVETCEAVLGNYWLNCHMACRKFIWFLVVLGFMAQLL